MVEFRVPAVPIAQPRQRHRVMRGAGGKEFVTNFTPAKHPVNAFKATVRAAAAEVYTGPPLAGPLFIRLAFILPRPSRLCWKNRPMPRMRHMSRPDLDNLFKAFTDALKGLIWNDDAQIASVKKSKWYAAGDEQAGVEVLIATLTEDSTSDDNRRGAVRDLRLAVPAASDGAYI